jgi:small-conductance mechanosensitive channel
MARLGVWLSVAWLVVGVLGLTWFLLGVLGLQGVTLGLLAVWLVALVLWSAYWLLGAIWRVCVVAQHDRQVWQETAHERDAEGRWFPGSDHGRPGTGSRPLVEGQAPWRQDDSGPPFSSF